jgi:Uma2 family endonuclease
MRNLATQSGSNADAYLAWEAQQPEKHEYLAGEAFAMVDAPREHVVVALNLAAVFKQRLRGGPCQAYVSDLKLRVEAADAFFCPDVVVSCELRDHAADQFIEHPILIVEVLSESTAAFDRGDKFAAYRSLASLQEYVLVDIPSRRVESFRRTAGPDWLFHEHRPEVEGCHVPASEVSVPCAEIFENIGPDDAEPGG